MEARSFSNEEVRHILEQVLVHQCACPSQLCRVILELRELARYERECLDRTATDVKVHYAIEKAAEQCEAIMNACLAEVLELEGWDPVTLTMPRHLQEHQLRLVSENEAR
ncbi:hypothetical protein [Azovibrio restrictus]|uniref:hypothetical protein n=1 Tax=Azovibrio restrictus TaxID=146938 RepID=UPI0026EEA5F2|nr:hypothetical protein [Azovibrio restrictus]